MNKNIFFTLLFVCLVAAQFDHVSRQGSALSLGSATSGANGLHREFSATVTSQFVVGGQCRDNVHTVSNVQLNNGPLNSGTYFSVTITHNANGTLFTNFGSPDGPYYDILQAVGGTISTDGTTGICPGSVTTCTFRYYCDIYPSENPLEVLVQTDCNLSGNPINFYDLSVTQLVETIQVIPASRSLAQSTAVVDPFSTTNLGPANFIHYYHDLNPTVAEAGASSRLYIEAVDFSAGATGTAYICVSYDKMVASTNSLTGVTPFTGNLDTSPITVTSINEPTGCPITCAAGNGNSVTLAVPACNNGCGFRETIWIGVVPPSTSVATTYTVRLRFRDFSVPDLITISATPSVSDGALVETCNGQQGDFGCDDYFEITYASVGSPSVPDRRVGPFLAVELFGVYNGAAKLELANGFLAGKTSLCAGCEPFSTCTVCEDPSTRPGTGCTKTDCWSVVQPCQWNTDLSNDWVFTVSAVAQDDATIPIEYGVRASIGSWPLTTVAPTAWETGQPNFGKVLVDHYSHYQVTFTDAQIFDDSYFEVELYTNYDDDVVGFAWNFNRLADDGTCYGSAGKCQTNTNCADGNLAIGSCRFAFVNCPISNTYNSYFRGDQDAGQVSGSKFSQLQAGTYYFAVWGIQPGSLSYNNAVEYTVYWNYHRAIPVYDQVTYTNFIYYNEYSPQYKFIVPEDDNIYQTRFRIADTQRGGLTAYVQCDNLAGDCPCWTFSDFCRTRESDDLSGINYTCDLFVPNCACPSGIVYVSVFATEIVSTNYLKPLTYSITPYLSRFGDFTGRTVIYPISASRAISPIVDTIADNVDIYYTIAGPRIAQNDYIRYYKVSLVNVDISAEDAILFTLRQTPQELFGLDSFYSPIFTNVYSPNLRLTVYRDYTQCQRIAGCSVDSNNPYYLPADNAGRNSQCTITLQPCYVDEAVCVGQDCTLSSPNVDRSFNPATEYFVSVRNTGTLQSFNAPTIQALADSAFIEAVQYTLNVQVVDQSPYELRNGVAFFGDVSRQNYVHFSFDASQAPADNRLVFTLYGDHDQRYPLTFYINYEAKAGKSEDCYAHSYPCYTCTLYDDAANTGSAGNGEVDHCYYEITPCELSRNSGTYYVSVYGLLQTDNDQALFTVQATYFPTVALLDSTGFGVPTPGNVRQRSSAYYSVTVPTLASGNIVGRVLSIDVEAVIKGTIYVTITQINPDDQCDCAKDGHQVTTSISGSRDDINWKRYSCELTSGEVYYISVEADQDQYCDPVGFVVHAKLQNIISIPISLTAVDSRIIGSFDSNSSLVLEYNQFTALTFTTNAPAGAVLDILITEATALFSDTLPFEVYLSIGSIYTPAGTNDGTGVGPAPDRDGCPALVAQCNFPGTVGAECRFFVDACQVPQGSTNWFLTFSGEQLPLNRQSEVLAVSIRLVASEAIITAPAISTYSAVQTTGLQFANTLDRSYGRSFFTTSSALGINAGDRLTFSVGITGDLYVSYGSETNADSECSTTCSASGASPTCTIYACESITAATWFFGIKQSSASAATATFTITRTQVENSTLSIVTPNPLTLNTDIVFTGLTNNEWRYHSFNVPASTSSHYELVITGGASSSNIVYVSSPVWLPYLALRPVTGNDVTFSNNGAIGNTCGGFTSALPEGTCCYDATTVTFAVVGSVSGYTLRVNVIEFAGNQVQSVSVPSNTTGTATLGRVNWYSFTQPAGAHLWFDFAVSSGSAELYLNSGSRAGSRASNFENGGDFGFCWGNDGLVGSGSLCNSVVSAGGQGFCDGFIASCNPCLAASNGYTFFFAVVPSPNATFSLQVISQTDRSIALGQNNGLEFPVPAGSLDLLDLRSSTDAFSAYAHYFYTYSRTFNGISNFIPVIDEPAVGDRFDYANLEIYIDNFRDGAGAASSTIPLRFYINYGGLAGATSSSGCYGGRDITTSGLLPCIENSGGAAFSNNTAIQCSINVCSLGNCGGVVYLSSGRLNSGSVASFTYDIEIIEDFNGITEWVDIVSLQVGTGSFPFSYFGDNSTDVVYIRYTAPTLNNFADSTSQYLLFSLTNVTGAAGTTTASFRFFDSDTCATLSSSPPVCSPINSNGICQLLTDPCSTGGTFFIDKAGVGYIRVSRDSSDTGAWSFIFNIQVLTVSPIDTTLTALSPALTTTSRTSYVADKEIVDFTWHFYEIFVTPTDGYSWLSVDVTDLCCTTNVNLEVYFSWEEQSTGEVFDNARPNRWASKDCNAKASVTGASHSSDINDICNFWGGAYRIGIFAPVGHQLFPSPILGVVYPALYRISATVNTVRHGITSLECPVVQSVTSSNFISRYELYVPAENRGSQLFLGAGLNVASPGGEVVLWASKNSNPWNRVAGSICSWDTTIDGDYSCSPTSVAGEPATCTMLIPACEFDDGIWYLFLQRVNTASFGSSVFVQFGGRLSAKKYTPTFDLTTADSITTSGAVFFTYYQYYRVLVNPADDLSLLTAQIVNTGCNSCIYDLYLSAGPRGFASDTAQSNLLDGPACVDGNGACGQGCGCSDTSSSNGILEWSTCRYPDVTSYYIGVLTQTGSTCNYDLTVWSTPRKFAQLPYNVETCSIASCLEYWEIVDAAGNTDLTGGLVEVTIANTGNLDIQVLINVGNVGVTCAAQNALCIARTACTYQVSCITGRVFFGLSTSEVCTGCSGAEYSILTTSVTYTTFATLSAGTRGSAGPATFTTGSSFVVANQNTAYSIGTTGPSGCGSACLRVLEPNSQYFFNNAAGLVLSDVGTINTLGTSAQSFTLSEPYFHFSVAVPAGTNSFTLNFDNVAYCACDGGSVDSLALYLRSSTVAPPFDGCYDCTGGDLLRSGSCPSSFAPVTFSCIAGQTYYFTISSCAAHTCDVTFTAFVEFSGARTQISGDHNTAFTVVSQTSVNCGSASVSRFYVEVTDILSVSLKEVHGANTASVSVTYQGSDCSSVFGCTAVDNTLGVETSCRAADCSPYSFATPGTYYIDVDFSISGSLGTAIPDSQVVYLQVVNNWVDLSGSVSNTIIGRTRHFYRLTNAASAISLDLTISEGPALTLIVFDDLVSPNSPIRAGFQETLVCSFGTCSVYISSFSEHSLSDTFYIEIDSANIGSGVPVFGSADQYTRATNDNAEKPTRYTLSATLSTGNCATPPSTGFCASAVEGGNVWSEINNSVWSYERPDLKDNEAFCRFNDLVVNCPNPSEECRRWLKVFSCLESFPQCDGSGFQMGVCQDVCFEVTKACGGFKTLREEFGCCSDRYVPGNDSTISTCYNIPPPPPPPETFAPEPGSDVSSVPPAFVVPVFTTIDVFLPDDFVRDKAAVHIENISSASSVVASFVLLVLLAFFF